MQVKTCLLQVGPIAVTSANPTGEADTTHHNQVYAKLGNKVGPIFVIERTLSSPFFSVNSSCIVPAQVDGVLCDGASPENIASTVVDCTKIETGHIGFFRVGLIPKSKVIPFSRPAHANFHFSALVNLKLFVF